MKRCPECRRDYYDDTLLYCLDDGNALLEGPASADAPATATLSEPGAIATGFPAGEATTRAQINTTDQTAIFPLGAEAEPRKSLGDPSERQSLSEHRAAEPQPKFGGRSGLLLGLALVVLLLVGGFFGYKYFAPAKQIDSIAVMPFVNESGNPDVEYLSDGIAETLISSLSQLPNLTVKPRSSVFRYKGKSPDAPTLGKELNVQTILTGTVVQRGGDIGLHIELIDAASDRVLWSEDYKRPLSNLLALQSEIVREVSSELKTKLSGSDERQLAKNYTSNPEAYQLYLKGRFYWGKRTKNDIYKSIDYFRQAVELDPNYALAYSGLADAYLILGGYDYSTSRRGFAAKARENAFKALSLDDSLSQAHVSVGLIYQVVDHNFPGSERELKRAIELNPNNPAGYANLGGLLNALGRMNEAEANYKRALELEPVSVTINRSYGAFLMFARRYDESVEQLKKTIDLDPNFILAYLTLSNTYQLQSKFSEAAEAYVKSSELMGDIKLAALMRESYAKSGWKGLITALDEGLRSEEEFRPPYIRATQFVSIGEKDKALAELAIAYEERDGFIPFINIDPRLDPLRDDPRFQELMRKVGFPE